MEEAPVEVAGAVDEQVAATANTAALHVAFTQPQDAGRRSAAALGRNSGSRTSAGLGPSTRRTTAIAVGSRA